jgi:hypothetical protein
MAQPLAEEEEEDVVVAAVQGGEGGSIHPRSLAEKKK